MKKPFALYTIDEVTHVHNEVGVFKSVPEKIIRVHKIFRIPIFRVYAEKITIKTDTK